MAFTIRQNLRFVLIPARLLICGVLNMSNLKCFSIWVKKKKNYILLKNNIYKYIIPDEYTNDEIIVLKSWNIRFDSISYDA